MINYSSTLNIGDTTGPKAGGEIGRGIDVIVNPLGGFRCRKQVEGRSA